MKGSRAVHAAVANPHVRNFVAQVSALQEAEWLTIHDKVQAYAERSAAAVERICRRFSIPSLPALIGSAATVDAFKSSFDRAVTEIGNDGLLVVSFAGHGRLKVDDSNDEPDGCDTTWLLHDRPLSDDELRQWLHGVPPGCTVIVVGDCCRAGGMELAVNIECLPNSNAKLPQPPPSWRAYLSVVDKGAVWVPGAGEQTFGEKLEALVAAGSCATYRDVQARLTEAALINKRPVIKCRPDELWNAGPFAKAH